MTRSRFCRLLSPRRVRFLPVGELGGPSPLFIGLEEAWVALRVEQGHRVLSVVSLFVLPPPGPQFP